ncbi:MAG: ParB/RepB/Spo0J family partition protein [Clostridia bacterium]|nr:ParB/RepB/Spo0J family partition protein [Clostridia bacterium]
MSKGLGRGLSSLFAIYEDEPKERQKVENEPKNIEKVEKIEQKPQETTIETPKLDILNNADNLLEKYQKKTPATEPEVNNDFLTEKSNLEKKLKTVSEEMYQSSDKTRQIPISRLHPNPDQPRKNFDQESLKELAQSIREHGIIQPIIAIAKDDNYIIIAGERRYRAAKMVGLKTIPVIVRDYDEQERREIALIENLQREDLNPIETAIALKQLIEYGFSQDEVAQKIGKSKSAIINTIRLLNLQPEVLVLVEKGKLAAGIARALITLPREEQIALAKKASDGKMTAREVEKASQELLNPESVAIKKTNQLSVELISMKDDMQQVFGTKVTILGNNKKGRIYFDYYNQDDLDRIYNLVNKLK